MKMAKGQHIFVRRPNSWITRGILHHGIDLGDGTVIHFTGYTNEEARVLRMNKKAFERSGTAEPFPYDQICQFAASEFGYEVSEAISRNYYEIGEQVPPPNIKLLPPDEVIYEARRWLGRRFLDKKYNPANNNCEHFATACATRHPFSLQVQYEKEFLQRRPSLGGLLMAFMTELVRFRLSPHAPPKSKDGWYYAGTTYSDSKTGISYREHYSKPGEIPPTWLTFQNSSKRVEQIDQKTVPYPLTELIHNYVDERGQQREEKA